MTHQRTRSISWVKLIGSVLWKCYDQQRDTYDSLAMSITQTAKIEEMLEDFDMRAYNTIFSPYQS